MRRAAFLGVGPDAVATWEWLATLDGVAAERLDLGALARGAESLGGAEVCWVHAT